MESDQINQQEIIDRIYRYTAHLMMRERRSALETRKILIEHGIDDHNAFTIVNNLKTQMSETRKEGARRNMFHGGLLCVGGILVTAATYTAASGGGIYIVASGAILFGAIRFIKGLASYYP